MQIKRLTYFDYPKLKKMVSYLCNDENDKTAKSLISAPVSLLNAVLPLNLKFQPESYILIGKNEILGLITTAQTPGNPYKINITQLIFKDNMFEVGQQLVNFAVQKLGGKGASSFYVTIDECHDELFNLFIKGCGFRQCASEKLWKIDKPAPEKSDYHWRYAQNSDAGAIADLYNSELINIYKPSLLRDKKEFQEVFFSGLTEGYKTRYILEDDKTMLGFFTISTNDRLNYILELITCSGYDLDYEKIINIMLCEIAKKGRAFYPIIKQKTYTKKSEQFETYLTSKKYTPIQTRQILVKDFYKPITEPAAGWKVFLLGENQITTN